MDDSTTDSASILLDNSTYFSFKALVEDGRLDAETLYHAAVFTECLVNGERLNLAPTSAWSPKSGQRLFAHDAPCRQLLVDNLSDQQLFHIFDDAINAAMKDVQDQQMLRLIRKDNGTATRALRLLKSWSKNVRESPRDFMPVYSGAVLDADLATKEFVGQLKTGISANDPPHRHLAQYLLRTNAAMEFARQAGSVSVPYHPHSHRSKYVLARLRKMTITSESLAATLIRETESKIKERVETLKYNSALQYWGGFRNLGGDAPLVLAVVLSGSRDPSDIVDNALELRNSGKARRYRKWAAKAMRAAADGDSNDQIEAEQELETARRLLAEELKSVYGKKKGLFSKVVGHIGSAIDLEKTREFNTRGVAYGIVGEIIRNASSIDSFLRRIRVKRHLALLLHLARERGSEFDLNDQVRRVFGSALNEAERQRFSGIRKSQFETFNMIVDKMSGRMRTDSL